MPKSNAHLSLRFSDLAWSRAGNEALLPAPGPAFQYMFHGRYAIYRALRAVRSGSKRVVMLPAYDCPVVPQAILDAGMEPRYYDVGPDLSPDPDDVRRKWEDGGPRHVAAIIGTNFFGFPCDLSAITAEMRDSAVVIEDCAHSFLNCNPLRLAGGRERMTIYSFWKIVPCMFGGALAVARDGPEIPPGHGAVPLVESLRIAKRLFEQGLDNLESAGARRWFARLDGAISRLKPRPRSPAFKRPGVELQAQIDRAEMENARLDQRLTAVPMPALCRRILTAADFPAIIEARRRNYSIYHEGLMEHRRVRKIFPALPEEVCPWVFPFILQGRLKERLDFRLRDQGVALHSFASTLHPHLLEHAPSEMVGRARFLADNLLCLSVHQNLGQSEIEASCEKINAFMSSLE